MKHFLSASLLIATGLVAPLTAAAWEKPVLTPFSLNYDGFISYVSHNGLWAVGEPRAGISIDYAQKIDVMNGTIIDVPITHHVDQLGEKTEFDGFSTIRTTAISEDGTWLAGSYEGDPGYLKDGVWYALDFPNFRRGDELIGYTCDVTSIRANGKYMIGKAYNTAFDIKPVIWIDGKYTKLEGVPDRDWQNHLLEPETEEEINRGAANMQYIDITDDGRYLIGGMSLNHPGWGCSYFVYDMVEQTYEFLGMDVLMDLIYSGEYYPQTEICGDVPPVISENCKYMTGQVLLSKKNDTDFGTDIYVPYVYNFETKEFKLYNDLAVDQDVCPTGITNDGQLIGYSPSSSVMRSIVMRHNDIWYDLESILDQEYGTSLIAETGYDATSGMAFGISPDGKTMVAMLPGASKSCYTATLTDRNWWDAASSINLMKPWLCEPAIGSAIARTDHVYVRFERRGNPTDRFSAVIEGENGDRIEATGVVPYNENRQIWTIQFPDTKFEDGVKYTVTIPAGSFVMDDTGMESVDISIDYVGREEKPIEILSITPADGSGMNELGPNNMINITTDYPTTINGSGYLYKEDNPVPVATLILTSQLNRVYAYPAAAQKLPIGVNYKVVIPEGAICDVTGACPAGEIVLNYEGLYKKQILDPSIKFEETFDDPSSALSNMLLYEGDHLAPTANMESIGFDTDNTPWNFSVRDENSTDYVAASHSSYKINADIEDAENRLPSDDWMVTQQVDIDSEGVILEFDCQGYSLTCKDRLKVIVWPCEDVYTSLDVKGDIVKRIREEGTVVYDEIVNPGNSAEQLEGEWTNVVKSLDEFIGKKVYVAFVNENVDQSLVFVNNIRVRLANGFSLQVTSDVTTVAADKTEVEIALGVLDTFEPFKSVKAELTCGDFKSVYEADGLSLDKGDIYTFTFPEEMPLTTGDIVPFTVTVTMDDVTRSVTREITNLAYEPVKRVVLEEATGAWCGNCPMGILAIEYLEKALPDNFIPVSIHNGDAYAYPEYEGGFLGFSAYPMGRVNRQVKQLSPMVSASDGSYSYTSATGTETFADVVFSELTVPVSAQIDVTKAAVSDDNKTLDVDATVTFALNDDQAHYNVLTLVLEDNLRGIQTNYFSNKPDPIFGEWGEAKDKVVTNYRDVARGIAGVSFHGQSGLLPQSVKVGENYNLNITFPVPTVIDVNNCKVVCMLIDATTGVIVNAGRLGVGANGIESVDGVAAKAVFTVAAGRVLMNGSADVEVYTMNGQRVANSNLANGMYVARAMTAEGPAVAKILVK